MVIVLLPIAAWLVAGTATAILYVVELGTPRDGDDWSMLMIFSLLWPLFAPCLVGIAVGRRIREWRERKPEPWEDDQC